MSDSENFRCISLSFSLEKCLQNVKRDLPACIIRVLINMYIGHLIRIIYFNALNDVKQGGVISPILLYIYIDDLLVSLSQLGVGCYTAGNFFGAIIYADDIVLISPTPLGMRKLLFSCDSYANEFDIIFNASKSKFLVCIPGKLRSRPMLNNLNLNVCLFILVIDLLKTSPHILTLRTLLIVIVMITIMFCKEDVILLFKRTMFFLFSRH